MAGAEAEFLAAAADQALWYRGGLQPAGAALLVLDLVGLQQAQARRPADNLGMWADEHVGVLAKLGVNVAAVTLAEDLAAVLEAAPPHRYTGLILGGFTTSTAAAAVNAALAFAEGDRGAVLVVGRADVVHPQLLRAAGAVLAQPVQLRPPGIAPAELTAGGDGPFNISLGPYAGASALRVENSVAALAPPAAGALATRNGSVMWAQLNDWRSSASSDESQANLGDAALFEAAAAWLRSAQERVVRISTVAAVQDVPARQAASLSFWAAAPGGAGALPGLLALALVGNLETGYCTGPCTINAAVGPRRVSLSVPFLAGVGGSTGCVRVVDLGGLWPPQRLCSGTGAPGPTVQVTVPSTQSVLLAFYRDAA